jgi:sulfite reductase (NADPH) flavoprotein alpha-component
MQTLLIPETAPFSEEQRAWLNGFVAGLLGAEKALAACDASPELSLAATPAAEAATPWHDPTLALDARMELAAGQPLELRLMAAMGQLDCGQCGYDCRSYAAALAAGSDGDVGKCGPGGRATAKKLKELIAEAGRPLASLPAPAAAPESASERGYRRDAPVTARLASSEAITVAGAEKETRHVVLDIGETGLSYVPGDALGVWPQNNPDEVELIVAILRAKGSEAVTLPSGALLTARAALTRECDLRMPTDELYELLAAEAGNEVDRSRLAMLAKDDAGAETFGVHDVLDVLLEFPSARPRIGDFVAALGRMQPRLYSIASSQRKHPREVHLTVGMLRYETDQRAYQGVGSSFLGRHLVVGRPASVFVQKAHGFRLPADPCAPVVMIGPGTGIAPFRAFLEEREAFGAPGRNWLFFGNTKRDSDFLYRDELEALAQKRVLTRMDLAFSRDQMNKVYVQHKMLEAAAELWRWIAGGAYLYVCGDAKRMAGDVDLALHQIASSEGRMDATAAKRFFEDLARDGRYQRDVY